MVGYVGRLNESVSAGYKFRSPVFVAEIDLDDVLARNAPNVAYRPLPKYPPIVRDISFLVGRDISFDSIREAVIDHGSELCRHIGFVDSFEGKGIEPGKRSITVRLEYRSDERTLVESEVAEIHQKIVDWISSSLDIVPRT